MGTLGMQETLHTRGWIQPEQVLETLPHILWGSGTDHRKSRCHHVLSEAWFQPPRRNPLGSH